MRDQVNQVASSSSTQIRHKKRKWSYEELLRNYQIVEDLPIPLPSCLPPLPSFFRSHGASVGSKRKREGGPGEQERSKRPRVNGVATHPLEPPPSQQLQPVRPEPPTSIYQAMRSMYAVVRRPRHDFPGVLAMDEIYNEHYPAARQLKYSSDGRALSMLPPTNKDHKPLANPPPTNSPYHVHGSILARLEGLDALLRFTYSAWIKDYSRKTCRLDHWQHQRELLFACRKSLEANSSSEREKALLGITYMIQAFIDQRKYVYTSKNSLIPMTVEYTDAIEAQRRLRLSNATDALPRKPDQASAHTPPMLPSPANTSSASSTPSGRAEDAPRPAPATDIRREGSAAGAGAFRPAVAQEFITGVSQINHWIHSAHVLSAKTQDHLTLPIICQHFPKTFARMMDSTLNAATDEYQVDFNDMDGELLWPGGCCPGEGIGWVCLMGNAMVHEIGAEYGYQGLAGCIPKP